MDVSFHIGISCVQAEAFGALVGLRGCLLTRCLQCGNEALLGRGKGAGQCWQDKADVTHLPAAFCEGHFHEPRQRFKVVVGMQRRGARSLPDIKHRLGFEVFIFLRAIAAMREVWLQLRSALLAFEQASALVHVLRWRGRAGSGSRTHYGGKRLKHQMANAAILYGRRACRVFKKTDGSLPTVS